MVAYYTVGRGLAPAALGVQHTNILIYDVGNLYFLILPSFKLLHYGGTKAPPYSVWAASAKTVTAINPSH